ncbi:PP2C family serine/threonine-protein phosphatase [Amycolatopsis sp. cg5]|uniref:PP2C family protein-serine/threonine phosphatase n=1 Tax=Amycolatopsis sp. cg5 TaxID=3238802 RepID=UPI0035268E6C
MNSTPIWHTASERGPRTINADAVGAFARHGQSATFALADGVGDSPAAAQAARVAASAAARSLAENGPVAAVLAAQAAVRELGGKGDAVLVVAVPFEGGYNVAWVGDVRAYAWDGVLLHQVTHDHTLAQYFRDHGQPAAPHMEHMVTTSVRTTRPDEIGTAVAATGGLVLTSDGVHKQLSLTTMRDVLAMPEAGAAGLVETAIGAGGRDNATAIVVEPTRLADLRTIPIVTAA